MMGGSFIGGVLENWISGLQLDPRFWNFWDADEIAKNLFD